MLKVLDEFAKNWFGKTILMAVICILNGLYRL